jgi:hypothetical protein
MVAREDHLDFKSDNEQKLFVSVMMDVIYQEFKFSKVERRASSIITKLVDTFDFVMFRSNFTKSTIMIGIKSLMLRIGYDISEVFFILKYLIVLELEESNNFTKNVTEISVNWRMIHDKFLAKVQEPDVTSKFKFFNFLEWITNTLNVALHTYDLFTHRHQLYHLSNDFCNKCHDVPKFPPANSSMEFQNWDYEHIRLDFFTDIYELSRSIIERVKEADLIDESVEILIELFTTLLQLSIDSEMPLTYDQKVFMLSVIFLPFLPMINVKPTNSSKEFKEIQRVLSINLKQFIEKRDVNQLTNLKLKTINSIPYLMLSKIGNIGTWLGTTITRSILRQEEPVIVERFAKKFKDILISNADAINQYLQAYRENVNSCVEFKWILCLQDKDVIVVKRTSPPNYSKAQSYDIFCKSCNQLTTNTNRDQLLTRMKKSKGNIISVDKIDVNNKLFIDFRQLFITPEAHKHFVHSIKTCITHNREFPKIFESDDGKALLDVILNDVEEILFEAEQCLDSIIKSVFNTEHLSIATKKNFFSMLYERVTNGVNLSSRNSFSCEIQKSYASLMTTIGCNAKLILSGNEILQLVINCFLSLTVMILGKDAQLRGHVVELSIKMLKCNGLELSQAFQWYQHLIEGVSESCLIECMQANEQFYIVLRKVSFNALNIIIRM